jgi:hypothetical protein
VLPKEPLIREMILLAIVDKEEITIALFALRLEQIVPVNES